MKIKVIPNHCTFKSGVLWKYWQVWFIDENNNETLTLGISEDCKYFTVVVYHEGENPSVNESPWIKVFESILDKKFSSLKKTKNAIIHILSLREKKLKRILK